MNSSQSNNTVRPKLNFVDFVKINNDKKDKKDKKIVVSLKKNKK